MRLLKRKVISRLKVFRRRIVVVHCGCFYIALARHSLLLLHDISKVPLVRPVVCIETRAQIVQEVTRLTQSNMQSPSLRLLEKHPEAEQEMT